MLRGYYERMQRPENIVYFFRNGYMQLSLLALAVIPELRIADLGLINVARFTHIPVIV